MKPVVKKIAGKPGYVTRNSRIIPIDELSDEELDLLDYVPESMADAIDAEVILTKLYRIDQKLRAYELELDRTSRIKPERVGTIELSLKVLRERRNILQDVLDKALPDKRSITQDITVNLNQAKADEIPDDLLAKVITGEVTEDELNKIALIFSPTEGEH